jgi:hypothetical protein
MKTNKTTKQQKLKQQIKAKLPQPLGAQSNADDM